VRKPAIERRLAGFYFDLTSGILTFILTFLQEGPQQQQAADELQRGLLRRVRKPADEAMIALELLSLRLSVDALAKAIVWWPTKNLLRQVVGAVGMVIT
jgi:hypothetical protein